MHRDVALQDFRASATVDTTEGMTNRRSDQSKSRINNQQKDVKWHE